MKVTAKGGIAATLTGCAYETVPTSQSSLAKCPVQKFPAQSPRRKCSRHLTHPQLWACWHAAQIISQFGEGTKKRFKTKRYKCRR